MSQFETAIDFVLRNEKGLVDNPHDNGQITNYGISFRFLKNLPPAQLKKYGIPFPVTKQTIIDLTIPKAKEIYRGEFWEAAPFEKIGNQALCTFIFDMAISMGIAPAIKCVQRACWSVMRRRVLLDDGILGEKTLATIQKCDLLLMPAIRSERAGYYRLVVANDSDEKEFIEGWLNRAYES